MPTAWPFGRHRKPTSNSTHTPSTPFLPSFAFILFHFFTVCQFSLLIEFSLSPLPYFALSPILFKKRSKVFLFSSAIISFTMFYCSQIPFVPRQSSIFDYVLLTIVLGFSSFPGSQILLTQFSFSFRDLLYYIFNFSPIFLLIFCAFKEWNKCKPKRKAAFCFLFCFLSLFANSASILLFLFYIFN